MIKKILIALLLILVIIQFIPALPENQPEPEASLLNTEVPLEVSAIMEKACYDCHSYSAKWPWYANVAPVSFWIGNHVKEGREHFNLSEWNTYSEKRQKHKAEEAVEEITEGEMPLESYTKMHSDTRLTNGEKEILIAYFKSLK